MIKLAGFIDFHLNPQLISLYHLLLTAYQLVNYEIFLKLIEFSKARPSSPLRCCLGANYPFLSEKSNQAK